MLSFAFDKRKCTGCGRCEAACLLTHEGMPSAGVSGVTVSPVREPSIGLCRHCEHAPCADACVSGAIRVDSRTGIVDIDSSRCVGCWSCVMECPFGAIVMVPTEGGVRATKCDGCQTETIPPCVRYCPTGALQASRRTSEHPAWTRRGHASRLGLRPSHQTKASIGART